MTPADRSRLTAVLRDLVARIADDLRGRMREDDDVRQRARKLHADEQVGEDFDVWTDLLARRAAVLWVLKSVYVRVLEDRKLLSPQRLLDPEAQQLFEHLAPNLGETAFLRWVYRDLASPHGGLPELFAPQPAEVAAPADALSRELIALWRERDPDSGDHWSFAHERFQGELMGDLYQELDPVVKDRFALCQTPDFVRSFILDRTLTPALETFGADQVRLLDPACGSGHFLIDAFDRIADATADQHPDWDRERLAVHCLDRVVGIDLNDYACALARARLVMTAAELAGVGSLAEAARFHPHVYWADGLEQVERGTDSRGHQLDLFKVAKDKEETRASLTRPETRAALRKVLEPKFHAVVANPPYITEKDADRKDYHREKIGGSQRYISAYRQYSLASPFTERCFQLAIKDGFVGLITSNNFMKREFGRALIEEFLATRDLTLVVDTSQAYIPFHGTPTVLLFARNRNRGPTADTVRAVMGKRGETGTPADPSKGRVWSSIVEGWEDVGFENEFISVAELPRKTLGTHPWSLGGGGAADLKERLDKSTCSRRLGEAKESIGRTLHTGMDDVFCVPSHIAKRIARESCIFLVKGEQVRDYSIIEDEYALFPYDKSTLRAELKSESRLAAHLWLYRTLLRERRDFGRRPEEFGLNWFEWTRFQKDRLSTPLSIGFAFVATHNHFALDRGGKVFNRTAPAIKLPADATVDDHLALLGLLNSSTACFWMKQVFHCKGSQGINEGMKSALWEQFFEFDATKLRMFPMADRATEVVPYARELDRVARERSRRSVPSVLAAQDAWDDAGSLRHALRARREVDITDLYHMVGLQEELDWLCYRLYGLAADVPLVSPGETEGLPSTWLPWLLNLAQSDADVRAAIDRGEDPGEIPTAWFERHRWEPLTSLPAEASPKLRARIAERRERIATVPELALIETSAYKRRWYRPDYDVEEKAVLETWITDRIESLVRERDRTITVDQLTASLQDDERLLAVAEVLTGRRDYSLKKIIADTVQGEAVPSHPYHVYKPAGLDKRAVWERTWADQRREDAGEDVTPEVPPAYRQGDFLKSHYWKLRGKLDVPKERFIAFTEVPSRDGNGTLYGWAGWTPVERIRALLALDENLEDAGVPVADRVGLLDSAWRLLPDASRDDAVTASRFKAELQALLGGDGASVEMLDDWRCRFPQPGARPRKKR